MAQAPGTRQDNAAILDRLMFLWRRDGIDGPAEAARQYGGGNFEMLKKFVAGERGITAASVERIARHHHAPAGWLMFGEGSPDGKMMVPLVGRIAAGQRMVFFDDSERTMVEAYFSDHDAIALEVIGDSMFPLARAGDLVFCQKPVRDFSRLIGTEAAVMLESGETMFKILQRGEISGLYDLLSYNAEPIRSEAVHSAGRFLGILRRGR